MRYLTKSLFKLAMECPTKLYYINKDEYSNQSAEDSFLEHLANGGYQVNELAKLYYPEGILVLFIRRIMKMSKFDILLKYIPIIQANNFGEWVIDKENNGISDNPIQFPFVDYSKTVDDFISDFYTFEEENKDMELPTL